MQRAVRPNPTTATLQGAPGADGATGADGQQGITGSQGDTGERGEIGPRGLEGPAGSRGATGYTGAQGPRGVEGVAVGAGRRANGAAGFSGGRWRRVERGDDDKTIAGTCPISKPRVRKRTRDPR